eukprot:g3385.t1
MPGNFGGLLGGEGQHHRPLSSYNYGNRNAKFQAFGYVRGHPGGEMNNAPTYQMSGSLPCLHQSAKQGIRPSQSFSDTHAKHILASLPPISPPWGPEGDRLRRREDREDIRSQTQTAGCATSSTMARPVFGFACVALLLCAVKVMCPSFVSAPRPMTPSIHQSTAVASKEALQLLQPEMAKQVTPAAVKSAALSAAFALMAEPAFAAEPGSYDVRSGFGALPSSWLPAWSSSLASSTSEGSAPKSSMPHSASHLLSRSTGKMVVYVCPCPHPPPVDKTMMKRYGKLESQLRDNWASLHQADSALKETRSSATKEVDSMQALKEMQEKEVQDSSELEEAQEAQVQEWLARTLDQPSAKDAGSEEQKRPQAEARWKNLFGDLGVAYAPPGTGWMAYPGAHSQRSASIFSQSSSYLGLKCGDVFDLAIRAKNLGPVSSITLPDELKKRLTRMHSFGPLKPL